MVFSFAAASAFRRLRNLRSPLVFTKDSSTVTAEELPNWLVCERAVDHSPDAERIRIAQLLRKRIIRKILKAERADETRDRRTAH